MEWVHQILQWFAGGERAYMTLSHCMNHDYFWIGATVALDLTVAAGYIVIARHWSINQRNLPDVPAKKALSNMRNIFIFCVICGYIFIPIKMFWPAWRLYDFFMLALAYFTWKYAIGTTGLKVVYSELGQAQQLRDDLEKSRDESRRKSFFLNAISHDLRTPLNGMLLQADLAQLCAKSNDAEGLQEAVTEIKDSARVTAKFLESLLDYARMELAGEAVVPTRFLIDDVIQDACATIRPLAERKHVAVECGAPQGLEVLSDRLKLERVLNNLVSNAVKFTDHGSVRVVVERAGSSVEVHVIDTGVGIDPAVQGRIFDEFYQVHNDERDRSKGFGLGLAIARRLAQQLGGDISVQSAPGRGSRFTVHLPSAVANEQQHIGVQPHQPAAATLESAAVEPV